MTEEPKELPAAAVLTRDGLPDDMGVVGVEEAARMCEAFTAGCSIPDIAAGLERPVVTVRQTLERFRPTVTAAQQRLKAGSLQAADRWVEIASTGNDYRAAKDLLLHNGVIQPLDDGGQAKVGIVVHIGQPGAPAGHDPLDLLSPAERQAIEARQVIPARNFDPAVN